MRMAESTYIGFIPSLSVWNTYLSQSISILLYNLQSYISLEHLSHYIDPITRGSIYKTNYIPRGNDYMWESSFLNCENIYAYKGKKRLKIIFNHFVYSIETNQ